jgi:hypothetical protein
MSEYQEEVLTGLLGLQAELRGDDPEPNHRTEQPAPPEAPVDVSAPAHHDAVAVTEEGLTVSVSPAEGPGVHERIAALNDRLAQLEYDLAGVTKRIERIEPDLRIDIAGTTDVDVDARWRSFLDLQKIVADRLDQR